MQLKLQIVLPLMFEKKGPKQKEAHFGCQSLHLSGMRNDEEWWVLSLRLFEDYTTAFVSFSNCFLFIEYAV